MGIRGSGGLSSELFAASNHMYPLKEIFRERFVYLQLLVGDLLWLIQFTRFHAKIRLVRLKHEPPPSGYPRSAIVTTGPQGSAKTCRFTSFEFVLKPSWGLEVLPSVFQGL